MNGFQDENPSQFVIGQFPTSGLLELFLKQKQK